MALPVGTGGSKYEKETGNHGRKTNAPRQDLSHHFASIHPQAGFCGYHTKPAPRFKGHVLASRLASVFGREGDAVTARIA
jgi:hypothetical protein